MEVISIIIPSLVSIIAIFIAARVSRNEERRMRIEEVTGNNIVKHIACLNKFLSDLTEVQNDVQNYVFYSSQIIKINEYKFCTSASLNETTKRINDIQKRIVKEYGSETNSVYANLCCQLYPKITYPELWRTIGSRYLEGSINVVVLIGKKYFEKDKVFIENYSSMFTGHGAEINSIEDIRRFVIEHNQEVLDIYYQYQKDPNSWRQEWL